MKRISVSYFLQYESSSKYLLENTARVRDIELLTGIKFFSGLPPAEQARLKTISPVKLWPWAIKLDGRSLKEPLYSTLKTLLKWLKNMERTLKIEQWRKIMIWVWLSLIKLKLAKYKIHSGIFPSKAFLSTVGCQELSSHIKCRGRNFAWLWSSLKPHSHN